MAKVSRKCPDEGSVFIQGQRLQQSAATTDVLDGTYYPHNASIPRMSRSGYADDGPGQHSSRADQLGTTGRNSPLPPPRGQQEQRCWKS